MPLPLRLPLLLLAGVLSIGLAEAGESADWLSANLLANPGFEETTEAAPIPGWRITQQTSPACTATLDTSAFLAGERSLRVAVPETGGVAVESDPVPVEPGAQYLASMAYRTVAFGKPGTYSGISSSANLVWLDAAGRQLGGSPPLALPYHDVDWDLRDRFVTAPAGATQAVFHFALSNGSAKQIGETLAATAWLDGMQLRRYTPPPAPEWAHEPVARIVEGGWDNSRVRVAPISSFRSVGGTWGRAVEDATATFGTAVETAAGVDRGMVAHSPYYPTVPPGLYRLEVRAALPAEPAGGTLGVFDIGSQLAGARSEVQLLPTAPSEAGQWQTITADFIVRTPGYWMVRFYTEGKTAFRLDTVRIFPLRLFTDELMLDVYPGTQGALDDALKPARPYNFRTLLVGGLGYDRLAVLPAIRQTAWQATILTAWVRKGRMQEFEGFPETPEELFGCSAVCLVDVDVGCLTIRQRYLLAEYVRRGGGLVVLGGHKAFNRGRLAGSLLAPVLPIEAVDEPLPPLVSELDGRELHLAEPHPITALLDVSGWQAYVWHRLTPRPDARVLMTTGDDPVMIAGTWGKGRVVCCALTPLGNPDEDDTPFWAAGAWISCLRNALWWVSGEDHRHFQQP